MPHDPTSFSGGGGYRPVGQAARVVEVPPTPATPGRALAGQSGPGATTPLLSVRYNFATAEAFCTISKALRQCIPRLVYGRCRVELVVPSKRGGQWYLQTRPQPGQGRLLPALPKRAYFRLPPVNRAHFLRPNMVRDVVRIQGPNGQPGEQRVVLRNQNVPVQLLRFRLGAEVAGQPGYFQLEPVASTEL